MRFTEISPFLVPWRKLPLYWLAQYVGAFLAAAVTYGVYYGNSLRSLRLNKQFQLEFNFC